MLWNAEACHNICKIFSIYIYSDKILISICQNACLSLKKKKKKKWEKVLWSDEIKPELFGTKLYVWQNADSENIQVKHGGGSIGVMGGNEAQQGFGKYV